MLVLTRKHQEKIRIGDSITITVLRTKGKAVRLGIEAPADVPVIRGELAFDISPEDLTREIRGAKAEDVSAVAAAKRPAAARDAHAEPNWTTQSHPSAAGRARSENAADVSLRRVPRDQVARELPKLVAGPRPLRGMLDARTSTL